MRGDRPLAQLYTRRTRSSRRIAGEGLSGVGAIYSGVGAIYWSFCARVRMSKKGAAQSGSLGGRSLEAELYPEVVDDLHSGGGVPARLPERVQESVFFSVAHLSTSRST